MLRLFQIVDTTTGAPIPELFFSSMLKARAERSRLNAQSPETALRYVVSPGPDHKKYHKPTR